MSQPERNWVEKLSGAKPTTLYMLLIVVSAIFLFIKYQIPVKPDPESVDLYARLATLPKDRPVLVQSDWTNSSRGESAGQFEALMRILMDNEIKFVIYSAADPQAPQVARNVIRFINEERKAEGKAPYKVWENYLDCGYFPNAEGMGQAMKANLRNAFSNKKNRKPDGTDADIWESPVLAGVKSIKDIPLLVNVTASATIDVLIERLGGQVNLGLMCTGVMSPQMVPYYASGQLKGLSGGLKGVYDLEWMMNYGIRGDQVPNDPSLPNRAVCKSNSTIDVKPLQGTTFSRGASYYLSLHAALTLMILAVVAGNLSLISARIKARKG
ncbi:MAG: hypothetical protein JST40_03840 [Armatimonadetes bacterium]|nr:hypothetical protein [Armatimonadota bacterium]